MDLNPISDPLKRSIRKSGLSLSKLAQATGIEHSALSRFLSSDEKSHRDILVEKTADRLATYFGLKLSSVQKAGPPATKNPLREKRGD